MTLDVTRAGVGKGKLWIGPHFIEGDFNNEIEQEQAAYRRAMALWEEHAASQGTFPLLP